MVGLLNGGPDPSGGLIPDRTWPGSEGNEPQSPARFLADQSHDINIINTINSYYNITKD